MSEDPLAPFTLISPADDVYVVDCQASTPLPCPGVHYVERALPIIQDIFTRLQNASCSDLGDINIITVNFTCSAPPTPTTASPMAPTASPMAPSATPMVSVSPTESGSSENCSKAKYYVMSYSAEFFEPLNFGFSIFKISRKQNNFCGCCKCHA